MRSTDVLEAVHRKYPNAAIVHELVVDDSEYRDAYRASYARHSPQFAANYWPDAPRYTEEHGIYLESAKPTRRIDALMMVGTQRTAIEVKVSRADFKRDTELKRGPWAKICHRFVYVVPKGLVTADEVAQGCGLWEVEEGGRVTVTKRATVNKEPQDLPNQVILALAYRAMKTG